MISGGSLGLENFLGWNKRLCLFRVFGLNPGAHVGWFTSESWSCTDATLCGSGYSDPRSLSRVLVSFTANMGTFSFTMCCVKNWHKLFFHVKGKYKQSPHIKNSKIRDCYRKLFPFCCYTLQTCWVLTQTWVNIGLTPSWVNLMSKMGCFCLVDKTLD